MEAGQAINTDRQREVITIPPCPPVLSCCVSKGALAAQQQLQGGILVEQLAGGVGYHRGLQGLTRKGAAAPCYLPARPDTDVE
jgi:hypothetical protein